MLGAMSVAGGLQYLFQLMVGFFLFLQLQQGFRQKEVIGQVLQGLVDVAHRQRPARACIINATQDPMGPGLLISRIHPDGMLHFLNDVRYQFEPPPGAAYFRQAA